MQFAQMFTNMDPFLFSDLLYLPLIMHMWVHSSVCVLWVCAHVSADAHRVPKEVSDLLELEVKVTVSHHVGAGH